MNNEGSIVTEIFTKPILQRTTETLIEMCSSGNAEQAATLSKSFQIRMGIRDKGEVFKFLGQRLDQVEKLIEVYPKGVSSLQLFRDILWQLKIAKTNIQFSPLVILLKQEELAKIQAFGSKLRGAEDHLMNQTTSLDCEQRIAFWADDSLSDAQRAAFIKKTYGSEHVKAIPLGPDWKKRRDWLYLLSPNTTIPNIEKRPTGLANHDLRILFETGPKLAKEIEAGQVSLDNQGRLLFPFRPQDPQPVAELERTAELLFLVAPGIFKLAHQNPGVVMCGKLVLLETTRAELVKRGVIKKAYREKAKAHHPDKGESDSEAMKRINFVNEVLTTSAKFEQWKSGKLYF
ncbi:MAG: hypothetical protein UU93_C0001G0036 [Candidatus Amesbacteria bacterium GW2011_GWA2_42_12]|uniref:J domain-containing protein n=1 Tax=Candidatus Amesbacteria bacterium GW2011_GWA2_42_12 TaxID=1618356 RepID=A0A0G0Y917_9BACT|nr:MAG: hypothetical protein UU93_C0001G0036 [Candidatus Amesbacteria bacterium GW2011_GWA2_42_12]